MSACSRLGARLRVHAGFKFAAAASAISVFFIPYLQLLRFPVFRPAVMPVTGLDRLVGFHPAALPLYLSLWIYITFAPGLMDTRRGGVAYYKFAVLLAAAGLAVFLVWPTSVPRLDASWARGSAFSFLRKIDGSGNACPSLHATFALFSGIWIDATLRRIGSGKFIRLLNGCWCAGILYSTLATGQHVAVDLFAGMALGLAGAALARIRGCPPVAPGSSAARP